MTERVLLYDELTGLARKQRVVLPLDAIETWAVGLHSTNHRGRNRTRGIAPSRFGHETNARQLQCLHGLGNVVVDRVRDVGEPSRLLGRPLVRETGEDACGLDVQQARELRGFAGRIGHEGRVGVHRGALDRHCEVAPVAVEHAPPLGVQRDAVQREIHGELLVFPAVRDLQLPHARREQAEPQDQQRAAHAEAARRIGRSHDCRRRARRWTGRRTRGRARAV